MNASRYKTLLYIQLAAVGLCAIAGNLASAQEIPGVTLRWEAPESCRQTDSIFSEAEKLRGVEEWRTVESMAFNAVVRQVDRDIWRLHFEVKSERSQGQRELELHSCQEVREAVAILIALALSPKRWPNRAMKPQDFSERRPESSATFPSYVRDKSYRLKPGLGAAMILDTDVLTNPTLAFGPLLSLRIRSLGARIAGNYYLPQSTAIVGQQGAEVSLALIASDLKLYYIFTFSDFEVGPVIGGEVGYLSGKATGVTHGKRNGLMWSAIEAGGELGWRLGSSLSVLVEALAAIPLRRPEFALLDLGVVRITPKMAFRAALAPIFTFR